MVEEYIELDIYVRINYHMIARLSKKQVKAYLVIGIGIFNLADFS